MNDYSFFMLGVLLYWYTCPIRLDSSFSFAINFHPTICGVERPNNCHIFSPYFITSTTRQWWDLAISDCTRTWFDFMMKLWVLFGSYLRTNQIKSQKYGFFCHKLGHVFECHDQNRMKSDISFSESEAHIHITSCSHN